MRGLWRAVVFAFMLAGFLAVPELAAQETAEAPGLDERALLLDRFLDVALAKWEDRFANPTYLGLSGDIPVPADYTGDGRTDLAVWRPGNGAETEHRTIGAPRRWTGRPDGGMPPAQPQQKKWRPSCE